VYLHIEPWSKLYFARDRSPCESETPRPNLESARPSVGGGGAAVIVRRDNVGYQVNANVSLPVSADAFRARDLDKQSRFARHVLAANKELRGEAS